MEFYKQNSSALKVLLLKITFWLKLSSMFFRYKKDNNNLCDNIHPLNNKQIAWYNYHYKINCITIVYFQI